MKNIMLDLETMGTSSTAAIVAIGAVFFEPLTGETGEKFYTVIDLSDSAKFGDLDGRTVTWWLSQSDEAREVFKDKNKVTLKQALTDFYDWVYEHCDRNYRNKPDAIVWGNGASFDNVILRNAYAHFPIEAPWFFANDRDVRTVVDLGVVMRGVNPKRTLTLKGVAHNALDDACFQVAYVSEIVKALA